MSPIYDVDVLLLLAAALAAKRRPAELSEIVAALDLIQGNIPAEGKLGEAFSRLGQTGLLVESAGRLALSPAAEKMVEALPRKGEMAERLLDLKGLLAAHAAPAGGDAILFSPEQLRAAILAHRAEAAGAGKNLLVPKPKPEAVQQRPGQRRRKPAPAQRRKR